MSNLSNSPAPAFFWGLQAKPAGNSGFYARDLTLQTDYIENQKQVFLKTTGGGIPQTRLVTSFGKNAGKTVPVPSGKNGEGLL
jgi:hypothetical protein